MRDESNAMQCNFERRAGRHSRHVEKGGRRAACGFLIAEEAAGATALSDHCPRKT